MGQNRIIFLILSLALVLGSSMAATGEYRVSPTGAYNDQKIINDAINIASSLGGGTVYLTSGVYYVNGPIIIKSDITLTGNPDAIIMVAPTNIQWFTGQTGIISNPDESLHNVEIYDFQIDGNIRNLDRKFDSTPGHDRDCEKAILIGGWSSSLGHNIKVHDMKIYNTFSDGIYIRFTDDVFVYNNIISNCQHEGFYLSCCLNGLVYNNEVAGITSDCGRLDNSQHFKIYDNIFFSYGGETWGAYAHGENGLQIGDQGGSSHGFTPSKKPFNTLDIEVTNNTFSDPGLRAIWLSSDNVYVHDNKFIDAEKLETMGIPVGDISFDNPPTIEMSEKVFSSIFDILDTPFYNTGRTEQKEDSINYSIHKTEHGRIAGGIKIIGFRDTIQIDNVSYIPDNESVIVKSTALTAPSIDFWNSGTSKIDKRIETRIENGTAYTTLKVTMEYYTISTNSKTGKTNKYYHTTTAEFNDSVPAPNVLVRPADLEGSIIEYPDHTLVYVPSQGLTKVKYEYQGNTTDHIFLIGERHKNENGVEYTNFTRADYWNGDIPNYGPELYLSSPFDPEILTVTAYTPYETLNVTHFKYTKKDKQKEATSPWFYPLIGITIILGFGARYYLRKIWYS